MKRKRFTEEHIIGVLKQAEAGAKTADLCRQVCPPPARSLMQIGHPDQ